jgi:2',3'-cyclic-nucleotide 2'-phosphodiesterase (5'-nucleotidase family)
MKKYLSSFFIASLLVSQLNVLAQQYAASAVEYKNYPVLRQDITDSSLLKLLKPYSDSVNKIMGKVIGFATMPLYEKQPESALGNFMADAMKLMAEKKFGRSIDAAVINSGGIRSSIPKGDITIKNAYEVMPFDNLIVLQELKGSVLRKFLDHSANKGGWGVSGIKMQIRDHRADSVFLNGKLLDDNATYVIALTDYVAGGGDYSEMLKNIPVINIGYLYRDAIIEYIQGFTTQGKPVSATIENRVINADR